MRGGEGARRRGGEEARVRGGEEARACATATARTDCGAARGATHKGRGARGSPQPDLRSWPRRRHLLLRRLLAAWRLAATRAAPPFALPSDVTPSPKRDASGTCALKILERSQRTQFVAYVESSYSIGIQKK